MIYEFCNYVRLLSCMLMYIIDYKVINVLLISDFYIRFKWLAKLILNNRT